MDEVQRWVEQNHPQLAPNLCQLKDWLWLGDVNLSGEANKPVRQSIKEYGFIFRDPKRHGGAKVLPNGMEGVWAHACTHPIRFSKKGSPRTGGATAPKPAEHDDRDAELRALLAQLG